MRTALYLLAAVVVLIITVAVMAPAQWATGLISSATQGRVELAETRGTVWNGSAVLVLASGSDPGAARASLPERLSWQLSPWSLLAGQIELTLSHPSALTQPLPIRAPVLVARRRSAPPPSACRRAAGGARRSLEHGTAQQIFMLSWDRLQIEPGRIAGNFFTAEWQQAFERSDTGFADRSLPTENQRSVARNSAGITNHFRSPRAQGQWRDPRGWALTLYRPRSGSGGHPIRWLKAQTRRALISLLGRRDGDGALLNFGGG